MRDLFSSCSGNFKQRLLGGAATGGLVAALNRQDTKKGISSNQWKGRVGEGAARRPQNRGLSRSRGGSIDTRADFDPVLAAETSALERRRAESKVCLVVVAKIKCGDSMADVFGDKEAKRAQAIGERVLSR